MASRLSSLWFSLLTSLSRPSNELYDMRSFDFVFVRAVFVAVMNLHFKKRKVRLW